VTSRLAGSVTVALDAATSEAREGCDLRPPGGSVNTNLIVNLSKPPFDNPDLRRAWR